MLIHSFPFLAVIFPKFKEEAVSFEEIGSKPYPTFPLVDQNIVAFGFPPASAHSSAIRIGPDGSGFPKMEGAVRMQLQ